MLAGGVAKAYLSETGRLYAIGDRISLIIGIFAWETTIHSAQYNEMRVLT